MVATKRARGSADDQLYGQLLGMPNYDIVTVALGLLATDVGSSLEDIALECHRLIPSRFCWTQHPDIPDMDAPRVSLTDARKEKNGAKVESRVLKAGRRKFQWRLTAAGHAWLNKHEEMMQYLRGEFPQPIDYEDRVSDELLVDVLHRLASVSKLTVVDVAREALRRYPARFAVDGVAVWPDFRKIQSVLVGLGAQFIEGDAVSLPGRLRATLRKAKSLTPLAGSLPSATRARDERVKYLNHIKSSQLFKRFGALGRNAQPTLGEICSLLVAPMSSPKHELTDAVMELEERVHGVADSDLDPFFSWVKHAIRGL